MLVDQLGIDPSPALSGSKGPDPEPGPRARGAGRRSCRRGTGRRRPGPIGHRHVPGRPRSRSRPRRVRTVVGQHGGFELGAEGGFRLAAFARARDAVAAAVGIERATKRHGGRLRIGINSAEATAIDDGYAGPGVRGAASIRAAAHRGQILLSQTTRDLLRETPLDEEHVRDLGEHRLNDLTPAQRLFQLVAPELDDEFPSLFALDTPGGRTSRSNRPRSSAASARSESGRTAPQPGRPARHATGTGGTGQDATRRYRWRPSFSRTSPTASSSSISPRWRIPTSCLARRRATLGVVDSAGETLEAAWPAPARPAAPARARQLRAPPRGRPCVVKSRHAATAVKLLVTSRAPLAPPGERAYPVHPLETPTRSTTPAAARLRVGGSVRSRARAARPDFAVTAANARPVAEICTALDGLPLAIELAAARVGVLPPAALLRRLDQRLQLLTRRRAGRPRAPARPSARRSTGATSCSSRTSRGLFARLAVFARRVDARGRGERLRRRPRRRRRALLARRQRPRPGGRDRRRAAVRDAGDDPRIRRRAARRVGRGRGVRRRHADHFLALAEEAEPNLSGREPAEWLDRLEPDHDNSPGRHRPVRGAARETSLRCGWRRRCGGSGTCGGTSRKAAGVSKPSSRPTSARPRRGPRLSAERPTWRSQAETLRRAAVGRRSARAPPPGRRRMGRRLFAAHGRLCDRAGRRLGESTAAVRRERASSVTRRRALRSARGSSPCWAFYEVGDLERSRELNEDNLGRARATHDDRSKGARSATSPLSRPTKAGSRMPSRC